MHKIFSAQEVKFYFYIIFHLDVEEDKNYESENLFETLVKTNQTQNPKIYDNYGMNNLIKNKNKEKEISNVGNISKNVQSGTGNKSILTQHQHQPPKKNIFDDNAFDIFDKSGKKRVL